MKAMSAMRLLTVLLFLPSLCLGAYQLEFKTPTPSSVSTGETYYVVVGLTAQSTQYVSSGVPRVVLYRNGAIFATQTGLGLGMSTTESSTGSVTYMAQLYLNYYGPPETTVSRTITVQAANQPPIGYLDVAPSV